MDISALLALREGTTPGPWRHHIMDDQAEVGTGRYIDDGDFSSFDGWSIATVWGGFECLDQNARLIAAAPDLLDHIEAQAAQIAALTAKLEAAEAKVGRLVEAVNLVKAHAQTQMRTADFHAPGCQCWRCAEDEMFAALAEIGGAK